MQALACAPQLAALEDSKPIKHMQAVKYYNNLLAKIREPEKNDMPAIEAPEEFQALRDHDMPKLRHTLK